MTFKFYTYKILLFLLGLVTFITVSCKKDEEKKESDNYIAAKDNSYAENVFADIFKWVDNTQREMEDSLFTAKGGKNVNYNKNDIQISLIPMDSATWPKTLTINFGSADYMCLDGKTRQGKIVATITGRYNKQGTVVTIVPSNYYVNGYYIEGTLKITCTGLNNSGNLAFKDEVTAGKLVTPDGTMYWECNRTREFISGNITPWPDIYDDVYHITGNSKGTDIASRTFEAEIINPLTLSLGCKWLTEGSLEITPDGLSVRTVDYGDGICNPQATVAIADKTYNFVMSW